MTCTGADHLLGTDSFLPFRLTMSASIRLTCGLSVDTVVAHTSVYSVPWPTSAPPVCPRHLQWASDTVLPDPETLTLASHPLLSERLTTCTRAGHRSETDSLPPFRSTMSACTRVAYGLPVGTRVAHTELCSVPRPTYGSPVRPCPLPVRLWSHHRKWKTRHLSPRRGRVPFHDSFRLT